MMNVRKRKKINIKLLFGFLLLLFFGAIVVSGFWKDNSRDQNLDNKLAIITQNGISLVSISNERKMINVLTLGDEASAELKNVLGKEKDVEITKHIFWYNFGFFPDRILSLNSTSQWSDDSVLINNLGFLNWLRYKKDYSKMLIKREEISGTLSENAVFLDEILARDFSESRLNNEELRLSVFNNTNESGLAGFMTKRLEWSGFSVVSNDNNNQKIKDCLIVYGNKTDLSYGWKILNKIFKCEKKKEETLNENELELYFGDSLASMIKYSSYSK